MPRLINAQARETEITAAAFRVLEREGIAGLSVRGVANEAGIATASLRRAFPTQHALREHCLKLIEKRVEARIRSVEAVGREYAEHILSQLLPLDKERRIELIAQAQLGMLALANPQLLVLSRRLHEGVEKACAAAIAALQEYGRFSNTRNTRYEVQRLHALIDGLAMRGIWSGQAPSPQQLLNILRYHLDELASPPTRD